MVKVTTTFMTSKKLRQAGWVISSRLMEEWIPASLLCRTEKGWCVEEVAFCRYLGTGEPFFSK
jgi:hypothetical protein